MLNTSYNFVKPLIGSVQLYSCDVVYDEQSGQDIYICVLWVVFGTQILGAGYNGLLSQSCIMNLNVSSYWEETSHAVYLER